METERMESSQEEIKVNQRPLAWVSIQSDPIFFFRYYLHQW